MTEHLLPRAVESLDEIESLYRDAYRENPTHDGFVLTTDALAQIEAGEKLLADQATEHAAELAALAAERAMQDRTIRRCVIGRELHAALAGVCKRELLPAAVALLAQRTPAVEIKIEGDKAAAVVMVGGEPVPLGDLAREWINSDAGAAFRPPPPHEPGPAEKALRLIVTDTLH